MPSYPWPSQTYTVLLLPLAFKCLNGAGVYPHSLSSCQTQATATRPCSCTAIDTLNCGMEVQAVANNCTILVQLSINCTILVYSEQKQKIQIEYIPKMNTIYIGFAVGFSQHIFYYFFSINIWGLLLQKYSIYRTWFWSIWATVLLWAKSSE